mgnify:CR=1 FL=1
MTRLKYIFRIVAFLTAIALVVYLNAKSDGDTSTIAEFKFKMYQKMRSDSLDSKHKLEHVIDETTKFIDNSSHVQKGVHYLTGLFTLVVIVELGFLIVGKRNSWR